MLKSAPMDKANELTDIPLTSEEIRFKPDELTACSKCGRSNPPNRLNCLYCAAQFEDGVVDSSKVKLALRHLENWENGFNVIAISAGNEIADSLAAEIGRNTGISTELLEAVAESNSPLPLARVESEDDAKIVAARAFRGSVSARRLCRMRYLRRREHP